jgi:hypothetical protein
MLKRTSQCPVGPLRKRGISRRIAGVVLTVGAAGFLVAAGIALGANSTVGFTPTTSFSFRCDGQPVPNQCPKVTRTTGKLTLLTQPDPFARVSRIRYLFDNDFRFRPWVVSKCAPNQLASADLAQAMATCGSKLIGTGRAAWGDPGGGSSVISCVLLFNGTNDPTTRDPRIVFYVRFQDFPSPDAQLTCEDPASNHRGDGTLVLPAVLRTVPQGDYRKELDLPVPSFGFIPLGRLSFDLEKNTGTDGYVKARCFDPDHVWNLRTKFTNKDDTTRTVNDTKTCKVG